MRMTYPLRLACALLFSLLCFSSALIGQTETATVSGLITDETGAVVPGAEVKLQSLERGTVQSVTTNNMGIYVFASLQPGQYQIKVQKPGFKQVDFLGLIVNVQDHIEQNFRLQIGSVAESVTVEANGLNINTTDATVSTVVDRQFVENMPLNGRTFQTLIELTPGVVTSKTSFSNQGQFNVNGQRASSNYFSVDGVSANTGITAGVGLSQTAAGAIATTNIFGGMNALVSVDALQEFRVQTSTFAPENGRTVGAQISIITRSGTNEFHGTLSDYLRNDKFDANNWFANATAKPKPALRQNDFGGTLGGPILKDRTFFFFSYEGLRLRQPQTASGFNVPSLAARQAAAAVLQPYLNAFPLPNGADLPNGFAIENATYSIPGSFDSSGLRIDQSIGKTSVFVRWAKSRSSTATRGGNGPLNDIAHLTLDTWLLTGGATSTISSTVANEARVNWTSTKGGNFTTIDNFGGAQIPDPILLFPAFASPANAFSQLSLGGASTTLGEGNLAANSQRQINLVDTISISKGNHVLKFGGDVRVLRPVAGSAAYALTANFTGVGDPTKAVAQQTPGAFLSGVVTSGSRVISRPLEFGMQFLNFSSFAQDTWKATSQLTITYGARWDIFPPPTGTDGKILSALTSIQSLATLAYAPQGTPLWRTDYKNLSPRIGVAYRVRNAPDKMLVVRAGAGIFYDLPSGGSLADQATSPPNSNTQFIPALTPFPYSSTTTVAPVLPASPPFTNALGIDPDFKIARSYEWNIAVEQQIGRLGSMSATYVGDIGRDLARSTTFNNLNSTFNSVSLAQSNATSDYHALQLQFRHQFGPWLRALGSYSWSHSLDNASNDVTVGVPFSRTSPQSERGSSDFDVRHSFSGAITVTSPSPRKSMWSWLAGNWSMDTIIQTRTAFPFNIIYARNLGFGNYVFRPDLDLTQPIFTYDSSVAGGRRLNVLRTAALPNQIGAFIVPATLRQGNLGRNSIRGFGMWQADIGVRREFGLKERLKLQTRMEMFNVFNHPNFADPAGAIAASIAADGTFTPLSTFGRTQSMLGNALGSGGATGGLSPLYQLGGPRSMQFSMKLTF